MCGGERMQSIAAGAELQRHVHVWQHAKGMSRTALQKELAENFRWQPQTWQSLWQVNVSPRGKQ